MKLKACLVLLFLWTLSLHAFSYRPLLIVPDSLIVPVGKVRAIHLSGIHTQNVSASIENENIGHLTSSKNTILVEGLAPGSTRIQFSMDNLIKYTKVYVREVTGKFPDRVSLKVTGTQISPALLRNLIIEDLNETIEHNPGATVNVTIPPKALPPSFAEGCALSLPVKVKISGDNFHPNPEKMIVNISNETLKLGAPGHLMVSNNPESFQEPSTLFKAACPDSSPTRIFYHHYNKGNVPYRFVLELTNSDSNGAKVHVLKGIAGPGIHEISVGASATERFFNAEKNHLGRVVEINKESSSRLLAIVVNPKETISGIVQLTPLTSSKFTVDTKIESISGAVDNAKMAEEIGSKPKGVFEGPDINLTGEYTVGEHYAFITLGKQSLLSDLETGKPNQGNYGAFYTIRIKINNPSDESKEVQLSFKPQAGPANGIFLIDESRLIKTPVVQAFAYYSIEKYRLAAHETKDIVIKTFAQGGSFYPVSLVVHPVEK